MISTAYLFLIAAALILLCSGSALRRKGHLTTIERVELISGIVFGAIGTATFFLGNDFVIPLFWRGVITVVGISLILLSIFIPKHSQSKKERLQNHHADVVSVLERLCKIAISPSIQKEGFYTTSYPFYVSVVENIKSIDRFGEALSHIRSGKEYKKCLDLYNNMERLESIHNQKVSEFMKETERNIRTSISNDAEISLIERSCFNLPTISSINLSQAPEPTQDFYAWVQQTYCGYNLAAIFDHFVKQSIDEKTLEIGTFDTSLGYLYPKLFRSGAPLEIIAISLPSTRNRIIKLKEFIDTVPEETIKQIGEFADSINKIRDFLNALQQCIEEIIHDEISLGLSGRCEKENKLRFRTIFTNKIRLSRY